MTLKKFVCVGDNHGAMVHKEDADVFFKFCDAYKPQLKVHLGDNWDFANLRRGADPREEGDDMGPDFQAGFDFLDSFRPNVLMLGNHDFRLWRAMNDSRGLVRKFAEDSVSEIESRCKKLKTVIYPYHSRKGVFTAGKLSFLHGYHAGIGAIAQHARIYRSCIFGHLHGNGAVTERGIDTPRSYCVGGLGDHETMDYAAQRTATLAWGPGWAYGVINEKTGNFQSWTAQKLDGRWMLPTGIDAL
jgi:hypothetical protein